MLRVLVIDDEPDVLLLCRVNLRHDGHEVLEAPDGATGLAMAEASSPDVVVLDLMMPAMDGYAVLSALREAEATKHLPVLVLSAKTQIEDRRRSLETGGDAFLAKPFVPAQLAEAVSDLVALDPEERVDARQAALRAIEERV